MYCEKKGCGASDDEGSYARGVPPKPIGQSRLLGIETLLCQRHKMAFSRDPELRRLTKSTALVADLLAVDELQLQVDGGEALARTARDRVRAVSDAMEILTNAVYAWIDEPDRINEG